MYRFALPVVAVTLVSLVVSTADGYGAATAGRPGGNELVIVDDGRTTAAVVVSAEAGPYEKLAAADLVEYIGLISGAASGLANTAEAVQAALAGNDPVLIVGQEAQRPVQPWRARSPAC